MSERAKIDDSNIAKYTEQISKIYGDSFWIWHWDLQKNNRSCVR